MARKKLNEISLMRPIILILLVLYHAFIIYNNQWSEPVGFQNVLMYKWIARFSYGFMLEAFVFMSGYLWYYQTTECKKEYSFIQVVINKFKRLLIPCFFFSALYVLCFQKEVLYPHKSFINCIYVIINGVGHMWFLLMLFWCFIIQFFLDKSKIPWVYVLVFTYLASLFGSISLPFQLNHTLHYFFFFYLGGVIRKYSIYIYERMSLNKILFGIVLYLVLFVILSDVRDILVNLSDKEILFSEKALISIASRCCQMTYSTLGVLVFYTLCIFWTKKHELPTFIINIGEYCFGVYLFQQFILKYLYYDTSIPQTIGFILLPWIGFLLAFIISLVLCFIFRLTKVGKILLG